MKEAGGCLGTGETVGSCATLSGMTAPDPLRRRGRAAAVLCLAWAATILAGCATPIVTEPPQDAPAGAAAAAGAAHVTTGHPVTVLDDGDGAELCLGGVMQSLPPQCGGPALVGWDWDEWTGHFEEAAGIRWGEFLVVGSYDAAAGEFAPSEIIPASEAPQPEVPADDGPAFSSPCPEPAGGWQVPDPARTTPETMDAAFQLAATLPGYSVAWMDQSPNPASAQDPSEVESAMNDPLLTIINVAVTEDLAGAEAAIGEVWGGMLCVSEGARTEAELLAIQEELAEVPGMLFSGPDPKAGVVDIQVVYDDGTLQETLDAEHGPGLVRVDSALKSVG